MLPSVAGGLSRPNFRARLTAILSRDTADVSTDLMLRILAALGYLTKIVFRGGVRHKTVSLQQK